MSMYSESLRAFLRPVLPYLDDPEVSEIMINGHEDVWIERKGRLFKTDAKFTEEGLLGAARNMAQFVGRVLSEERPRLDARLPDGSRIHVVIPPIARRGTTVSIRKFFKEKLSVDGLLKFGSLTAPMARLIEAAIHTKLNIIVSGGTGSGKTTLLNIVSSLIPDDERILTIEDSAELQLGQTHLVAFESRPPDKYGKGGVDMGDLLHSALRLRPDRIIVGEVRGGEAFHLIQAMNTGHGGSLSTAHANSPTDALRRLESLCLMSAVELPMVAVRAQVASAINLVICCERLHDGSRKVTHISEVLPLNDKGEYRTQDLFVYTPVAKGEDGQILGYHAPTGIIPQFVQRARAYGFEDLDAAFFDPATYDVPPPPQFAVGEAVVTRWAPSLKHRETGLPDPESFQEAWHAFGQKLKLAPTPQPVSPASPPRRTGGVQSRQVVRAEEVDDSDKTPAPTRNPLARAPAPSPSVNVDEPKVEIADDLLAEGEAELLESMSKTLPPRPDPLRPTPARRPLKPWPEPGKEASDNAEKTHIRPIPTRRKPS
ncbi:MAG: CpaF family protein [Myxococcaceae bacterium]